MLQEKSQMNINSKTGELSYFELINVKKIFKNKTGIKGISFNIKKGSVVGFIGDNGAGKTTTIKLIFNEYRKQTGKILYKGKELKGKKALSEIAFFPDQNNFPKHFNIVDFAMFCGRLKGVETNVLKERTIELLKILNLENFAKNKFSELSAGLQKRALLLATLITNPEIIILDEPTANVDVKTRLDFMKTLEFLSKDLKKTIMITSHNIDELASIIDHAIIIYKGDKVYDEVFDFKKQNLKEIYYEVTGGNETSTINFDQAKVFLTNINGGLYE